MSLCAAPNIAIFPSSVNITVDKANEQTTIESVTTLVLSGADPYTLFVTKVPLYPEAVTVTPAGALVYQGKPLALNLTIKPRLLPTGIVSLPIMVTNTDGTNTNWTSTLAVNLTVTDTRPLTSFTDPSPKTKFASHFAVGAGWTTEIWLVNKANTTETFYTEFLSPSGDAATIPVSVGSSAVSHTASVSVSLAGNAMEKIILQPASAMPLASTGSVRITSSNGADFSATVLFKLADKAATLPMVTTASQTLTFPMDTTQGNRVGLAIQNVNDQPRNVQIKIVDKNGHEMFSNYTVLNAYGQTAVTLPLADIQGSLQVSTAGPFLTGISLQFTPGMSFVPVLAQ